MDRDEAFRALGLKPLTIYMSERPVKNSEQIGATTWMLVEAALTLMKRSSVVLLGRSLAHANTMLLTCLNYHTELVKMARNSEPLWASRGVRHVSYGGTKLRAESYSTYKPEEHTGMVFHDEEWEALAAVVHADPHTRVRYLKESSRGWRAHDHSGHYLFTLSPEAGEALLARHPTYVLVVG